MISENSIMQFTGETIEEPSVETVGYIEYQGKRHFVPHILLDSGAKRASYIGLEALQKMTNIK